MHTVVRDNVEEFLSGGLEPIRRKEIEAHLTACAMCREEIRGMEEISELFESLRPKEAFEPSRRFVTGMMQQLRGQSRSAASFSGLFSLDFSFARHLVFACLLMLAVLGGYLATHESGYVSAVGPDELLAQQELPAFSSAPGRDNMLVTLTAYDRH